MPKRLLKRGITAIVNMREEKYSDEKKGIGWRASFAFADDRPYPAKYRRLDARRGFYQTTKSRVAIPRQSLYPLPPRAADGRRHYGGRLPRFQSAT